MASYFTNGDLDWTKEALDLNSEITNFLKNIFEREISRGHSVREIAHVAQYSVSDIEVMTCLELKSKKK